MLVNKSLIKWFGCHTNSPKVVSMVTAPGYDISRWRDILLRLGQTKVYFTTTATLPYKSKFNTPDYQ